MFIFSIIAKCVCEQIVVVSCGLDFLSCYLRYTVCCIYKEKNKFVFCILTQTKTCKGMNSVSVVNIHTFDLLRFPNDHLITACISVTGMECRMAAHNIHHQKKKEKTNQAGAGKRCPSSVAKSSHPGCSYHCCCCCCVVPYWRFAYKQHSNGY